MLHAQVNGSAQEAQNTKQEIKAPSEECNKLFSEGVALLDKMRSTPGFPLGLYADFSKLHTLNKVAEMRTFLEKVKLDPAKAINALQETKPTEDGTKLFAEGIAILDEMRLNHPDLPSLNGFLEFSKLHELKKVDEMRTFVEKLKQEKLKIELSGALMQAIAKGDTKAVNEVLTTAISVVRTSKVENLNEFICLTILPAYENKDAKQFKEKLSDLTKILRDCARVLINHKQFNNVSTEIQHFFNYYYGECTIPKMQKMAKEGSMSAMNWLACEYNTFSKTYRERAQMLMQACLIMMKVNPLGLVPAYINNLNLSQTHARSLLEAIKNDSNKKDKYRRFAKLMLREIDQLEAKIPVNPISYILAKVKNDKSPQAKDNMEDLVHALKDAFDYSSSEITQELGKATTAVLPGRAEEKEEPAPLLDKLPTLDIDPEFESQMPISAKVILYTAYLLKHANYAYSVVQETPYYRFIDNMQDDEKHRDENQLAKWCMVRLCKNKTVQAFPIRFILDKVANDEKMAEAVLRGVHQLQEFGIQLDPTPRPAAYAPYVPEHDIQTDNVYPPLVATETHTTVDEVHEPVYPSLVETNALEKKIDAIAPVKSVAITPVVAKSIHAVVAETPAIEVPKSQVNMDALELKKESRIPVVPVFITPAVTKVSQSVVAKVDDLLTPALEPVELTLTSEGVSLDQFDQLMNQNDEKLHAAIEEFGKDRSLDGLQDFFASPSQLSSTAQMIKSAAIDVTNVAENIDLLSLMDDKPKVKEAEKVEVTPAEPVAKVAEEEKPVPAVKKKKKAVVAEPSNKAVVMC